MKGGVAFDSDAHAYRAVVHSWDNAECIGEPREWLSNETFPTDDAAMNFYKMRIRVSDHRGTGGNWPASGDVI